MFIFNYIIFIIKRHTQSGLALLYMLRLLDLKYETIQSESGLITEVVSDFYHRHPSTN